MKFLVCVLGLCLLGQNLMADDEAISPAIANPQKLLEKRRQDLRAELATLETERAAIEQKIDHANDVVKSARALLGDPGRALTKTQVRSLDTQIAEAKENIAEAKANADKSINKINDKKGQLDRAESAEAANLNQIKDQVEDLKDFYLRGKMLDRFRAVEGKAFGVQQQIDMLERLWDQSKLAAYIQAKMQRAFDPNNLCAMTKVCAGAPPADGKYPESTNESTVNKIFYNKNGELGRPRGQEGSHINLQ